MLKLVPRQLNSELNLMAFATLSNEKLDPTMSIVSVPIEYGPDGTRHGHDQKQRKKGIDKLPDLWVIRLDTCAVPKSERLHGLKPIRVRQPSYVGLVCPKLGYVNAPFTPMFLHTHRPVYGELRL